MERRAALLPPIKELPSSSSDTHPLPLFSTSHFPPSSPPQPFFLRPGGSTKAPPQTNAGSMLKGMKKKTETETELQTAQHMNMFNLIHDKRNANENHPEKVFTLHTDKGQKASNQKCNDKIAEFSSK